MRTSGTTCGRNGGCRSTSTCSRTASTTRGARAAGPGLRARPGPGRRLRPAAARPDQRRSGLLGERPLVARREAPVPAARRFADGLPAAARVAPLGSRTGSAIAVPRCADPLARRGLPLAVGAEHRSRRRDGRQAGQADPPIETARAGAKPASSAPPSASNRARAMLHVFMPPVELLEDYLGLVDRRRGHRRRDRSMPVSDRGLPPAHRPPAGSSHGHARPRRHRSQRPPGPQLDRSGRDHDRPLRGGAPMSRLGTEKFMLDGRHTGTGGGNHVVIGGATPSRQPVPAPARPAAQPGRLLASTTRRCRTSSPACSWGRPARRRGSTRPVTTASTSWRWPSARFGGGATPTPLAGRPGLPPPAGRRHRQHAPGRVLHRQALHARQRQRPPGAGRAAGLRDAAASRR